MRKTSSIASLALLAFALASLTPPAAWAHQRVRGHAAAHAKAATTSSAKHRAKAHAVRLLPGSKEAVRAHARIRAAKERRRVHGGSAPPAAVMIPVRFSMPPPLRGSHESLVHQNEMAEADGLERIQDDADLADRIAHGSLVPVPTSASLRVNTDLPENRRYCRPWTAKFLSDLAKAHAATFAGSSLEVTSAVRTVAYQRQLRHINGNAAAADGDVASPHLTGGTIDLAKAGMTAREIGWLRAWLIPQEQAGKIDVEEEFRQSCFHISVYKSYAVPKSTPGAPGKQGPVASASMLAAHGR